MTKSEKQLINIIHQIWGVLTAADIELEAYKGAIKSIVETNNPAMAESLNAYVVSQRHSSALREKMNKKYRPVLETLLSGLPDDLPPTDLVLKDLRELWNL
jgi:hypothetical protein